MADVILASGSRVRAALLEDAGVDFEIDAADIDEAAIKAQLDSGGETVAARLADEKACTVSARRPTALVIGADQVLSCDGRLFDKPSNLDEARANLLVFRGRPHILHSGLSVARGGRTVWRYSAHATLTMRSFSDSFLEAYLGKLGDKVLTSVGCYQLEGLGIQLFEKIDGDYFTILGLPLLPLLDFLRGESALTT